MEELVQEVPGNTNSRKIKRLLLWLPSSSGHFLDKLIQCLREGGELGHWEVAGSLERALWTPMSSHNVHYAGVNNSTLVLCGVGETHRGLYCCRVTSSCSDRSVLSEPAHVELVKPDGVYVCPFIIVHMNNVSTILELAPAIHCRFVVLKGPGLV